MRAAAKERQRKHRDRLKREKVTALAGQFPAGALGDEPPAAGADDAELHADPDAPQPPSDDAGAVAEPNDAAAAVEKGKRAKGARGSRKSTPAERIAKADKTAASHTRKEGWVRRGWDASTLAGRPSGQLRDLARRVFELDGLPYLQELMVDPGAKDADRLKAVDIVAKLAVGYITPDIMNAEDAPDLPAPIFTTSEGELPGGEALAMPDDPGGVYNTEGEQVALYAADDASDTPEPPPSSGAPVPFMSTG